MIAMLIAFFLLPMMALPLVGLPKRAFAWACVAVVFIGGIGMIIFVGYPGDGAKGVPTMFGRMERMESPRIARRW